MQYEYYTNNNENNSNIQKHTTTDEQDTLFVFVANNMNMMNILNRIAHTRKLLLKKMNKNKFTDGGSIALCTGGGGGWEESGGGSVKRTK